MGLTKITEKEQVSALSNDASVLITQPVTTDDVTTETLFRASLSAVKEAVIPEETEYLNNMIYFKKNSDVEDWTDEDVYVYFFNALPENFNRRYSSGSDWDSGGIGHKMTLIDEKNLIYAYPRLNYTHVVFSINKVVNGWKRAGTSDLLVPLPTHAEQSCYYQSPIGYDGVWGDLATNTARIYLQYKSSNAWYPPEVTVGGTSVTVYPIGITGNELTGNTLSYAYFDIDIDDIYQEIVIVWYDCDSGNVDSTDTTEFNLCCYNHPVIYTSDDGMGYFNGDVDKYFGELIGYDTSKYLE